MHELPQFTHRNETFRCLVCNEEVPPLKRGCRNHCPHCLSSLHVDKNPGDRANPCGGVMRAISYEISGKKGIILTFKCQRCGEVRRNKAAYGGGEPCEDQYEKILTLKPM